MNRPTKTCGSEAGGRSSRREYHFARAKVTANVVIGAIDGGDARGGEDRDRNALRARR